MKPLNTSQFGPEKGPDGVGEGASKKDRERIEVGRGVKKPSLHGLHTLETKRKFEDNEPNKVDLQEDMALQVRKAVTLDYLEGGGDGGGDNVTERLDKFKSENPAFIDLQEMDALYPTQSSTKSDPDYDGDRRLKD